MRTRLHSIICRLRTKLNDRGMALTEFALVAPFLIVLYLGGFQLMDGVSANRKVTTTARGLADLTSQYQSMSAGDVATVLSAAEQYMSPYSPSSGQYRISQVVVQGNGSGLVSWSFSKNGTARAANSMFVLPTELRQPGLAYIVSEVEYTYRPAVFFVPTLAETIRLRDQLFMLPRGSSSIPYTS